MAGATTDADKIEPVRNHRRGQYAYDDDFEPTFSDGVVIVNGQMQDLPGPEDNPYWQLGPAGPTTAYLWQEAA